MSKTSEEPWEKESVGDGDAGYRTACLRLPRFPLQLLCRQRPEWQGEKVAWLHELKADAPVRYLSGAALEAGLEPGVRYATALSLIPDLLAGTSTPGELRAAEQRIVLELRRFTPNIRRGSEHLESGLYLLDASGLQRAFGCMENWAHRLCQSFQGAGWQVRVAVGFTPFATELATYHLSEENPVFLFSDRTQEQKRTLSTPLTLFSLSPDQVRRLERFGIVTLEHFLALEAEEVHRRFGADMVEFYDKAAEAIFAEFHPLPESRPVVRDFGFAQPVSGLEAILEAIRYCLQPLLRELVAREEGVAQLQLLLLMEDGGRRKQVISPSFPTVDLKLLLQLVTLRLESYLQKHPLHWGARVERLAVLLKGEPDPEKQGELFRGFAIEGGDDDDEPYLPRDREAGLWALSRVRAEFGEQALVRAEIQDHFLPGRDYQWASQHEARLAPVSPGEGTHPEGDRRVRRHLSRPVRVSSKDRWKDKVGPFPLSGGWWDQAYDRDYFMVREGSQTGWLYWDKQREGWFVEGWLQ